VTLLYENANSTRQNFKPRTATSKSKEGSLRSDKESVLKHRREHFDGILNKETTPTYEPSPLQGVSVESQVDSELTMKEMQKALHKMKNSIPRCIDTILSELIKFGGESLIKLICELIGKQWHKRR
jgi:hypothetical protein